MPSKQAQTTTCLPSHLQQYVLTEGSLIEDDTCYTKEAFRINVFLPNLDHIVAELTRRLTGNHDVFGGVSAPHPRSKKFLGISLLEAFADHYLCATGCVEIVCKLIAKVPVIIMIIMIVIILYL